MNLEKVILLNRVNHQNVDDLAFCRENLPLVKLETQVAALAILVHVQSLEQSYHRLGDELAKLIAWGVCGVRVHLHLRQIVKRF